MSHVSVSQHDSQPDTATCAEPLRPTPRLHYLHSYAYVFEGSDPLLNLTRLSACMFIPIVGPIVLAGYQYEIIDRLHRHPQRVHPPFEFSRFGDYLGRGVWKFLADLLTQMIFVPVGWVMMFGGLVFVGVVAAIVERQTQATTGMAAGVGAMIVVPLVFVILLSVTVTLRLVVNPLVLKASLSGEGSDLFDFAFMKDFVRRTWRESLLELLWIYVTFPVMVVGGLLLCFVGVYPAVAWAMLADAYTNWQLYEIYLARGGAPISLKKQPPNGVEAAAQGRA